MKDEIVRIDKASGEIDGVLDAFSLSVYSGRPADAGAVFNGIAHDPGTGRLLRHREALVHRVRDRDLGGVASRSRGRGDPRIRTADPPPSGFRPPDGLHGAPR